MYGLYGLKHCIVEISQYVTMRDGRTNKRRRTSEDNATQPLDAGRLSFAIIIQIGAPIYQVIKCVTVGGENQT